jgi:hypothetical protein
MVPQCAVHGHQPVAECVIAANACRNREAAHSFWQGDRTPKISRMPETINSLPILIQQIAVAQVGDARAPDGGDAP